MASIAIPRAKKQFKLSRRLVAIVLVVAVMLAGGLYLINANNASAAAPSAASNTYVVTKGSIVSSISGSGSVATVKDVDLSFQTSGTVAEVLVQQGDEVTEGQVLARLDDQLLQLAVANAQNNLTSAQAELDDLSAAPSAADLSAAKLAVVNAELNLETLNTTATAADLASARASLLTAQQTLADLKAGATASELLTAQDNLERAKNSLWSAQIGRDATCVQSGPQCDQANISVASAEISVREAQATLDQLQAGASATDLMVAQLAVQQASARLAELSAAPGAKELAAAQLQLENAQARLDELTAGPTALEVAQAQASVDSAKIALLEAQANLDAATLKAPFAGTITAVNIAAGDEAGTSAAVSLVSRTDLHVDLKLTESDAVQVKAGQSVTLTIDSLDGKALAGTVSYVSPVAETNNGVVTYAVRVAVTGSDSDLLLGMTANVEIVTAERQGVLIVPNTALLPADSGETVVVVSQAQGSTPGGQRQVQVQTGLSNGTYTEILSGVSEGDVIQALATATTTASSSAAGGGAPGGTGLGFLGGLLGGGR